MFQFDSKEPLNLGFPDQRCLGYAESEVLSTVIKKVTAPFRHFTDLNQKRLDLDFPILVPWGCARSEIGICSRKNPTALIKHE